MRHGMRAAWAIVATLGAGIGAGPGARTALGQIVVTGADGSDGALNITANTVINLDEAVTGTWNAASTIAGKGVYDPEQWAVVFKYNSVNIAAGSTLTFANHRSHAPVVWLVSGDVTIAGTVDLSGRTGPGGTSVPTEPGPGGFRGAIPCSWSPVVPGSAGFGPGGGGTGANCGINSSAGGHASPGTGSAGDSGRYGSALCVPLIGGSGGGRWFVTGLDTISGGGGGGAILIACTGTVTINGSVLAKGGSASYGGAGGVVRIVAAAINGAGAIRAVGNSAGGQGRIRLQGDSTNPINDVQPPALSESAPTTQFRAFPDAADNPKTIRIDQVDSVVVTVDPLARLGFPVADVIRPRVGSYPVRATVRNMSPAQTVVRFRVVPESGAPSTTAASFVSGTTSESIWEALVPIGLRTTSVLQATASTALGPVVQDPQVISREVSVFARFCAADLDGDGDFANGGTPDGGVTIDDLLYLLVGFEAGDSSVDLDNDGDPTNGTPDGAVTIDDLLFFLARFEAGC